MTFNTNYTCFLFRVIIGVTNYSNSFTAVYLYIKAELVKAQYWFIKQYTKVYQLEAQLLKVVVANFSKGLYTALLNSKLLTAILQFYQQYAFQVIYKKINSKAYLGKNYNKKRRIQIKSHIQLYSQAVIIEELSYCYKALL